MGVIPLQAAGGGRGAGRLRPFPRSAPSPEPRATGSVGQGGPWSWSPSPGHAHPPARPRPAPYARARRAYLSAGACGPWAAGGRAADTRLSRLALELGGRGADGEFMNGESSARRRHAGEVGLRT